MRQKEGGRVLQKKDRAPPPNTNPNAHIKPHLVHAKSAFLGKTTPDCGVLCCVHHAKVCGKPLFPLIIDLCAPLIMDAARLTALLISPPA